MDAQESEIRIQRRDIIVTERGEDGSRFIVDAVTLVNPDSAARVSDSGGASIWMSTVPGDVTGLQVTEGDYPPAMISHQADRVVLREVRPGLSRIVLQYVLPPPAARHWDLLLHPGVDTLWVATDPADIVPRGAPFDADSHGVVGRARLYRAVGLAAGTTITFGRAPRPRAWHEYWWVIVVGSAAALGAGLAQWVRRQRHWRVVR